MKKPDIKINFIYYGTPFDTKKYFLLRTLRKRYNVIISDKPDYVFFSVYRHNNRFLPPEGIAGVKKEPEKQKTNFLKNIYSQLLKREIVKDIVWFLKDKNIIKPYARIFDLNGDFVKIFYTSETIKPDMSKCDWAFGPHYESDLNNHPRYMRIPPFIISGFEHVDLRKKKQDINKIKREKTRFCNFIYSNHVPLRNKFFRELSKYKRVDAPGKCMNNMPPIGSYKSVDKSRSSNTWMEEKLKFLSNYKFTIGFENKAVPGYITEKLIDPILANSIPIYFGSKEIGKEFNKKSFINFHDFKNMRELVKYVIKVDKDDKLYEKMLREPWLKDNRKSIWMNEYRVLKRMEDIVNSRKSK
jgi:hypothetical protein